MTNPKNLMGRHVTLFVEGLHDQMIVGEVLSAAKYELDHLTIIPKYGKHLIAAELKKVRDHEDVRYAALIDLDVFSVADTEKLARAQLGNPDVAVFCAVPAIESWLFADIDLLRRSTHNEEHLRILDRLPLPEEIPHPKQLLKEMFGGVEQAVEVLHDMNIELAASRSPSLRVFIEGIGRLLGVDPTPVAEVYASNISRDIFSNLLSEVIPSDTIVYRTMSGEIVTAESMLKSIREGTELGKQYASDVLRAARDMVARKAQRMSQV